MNYNFSEGLRAALSQAREEAHTLGHDYVGTEHLLLGLLASEKGPLPDLTRLGASPAEIRQRVEARLRPGKSTTVKGELPYTSRAKRVLEFALSNARKRREDICDLDHLLAGLLLEEKGIAATVLSEMGITAANVDEAFDKARRGRDLDAVHPRFGVAIDDASELSIYEQIIARVNEAVATGELRAGDRLPTVRQLADDSDVAPGTVARAYSELERQGVVVTDGARGTRIAERGVAPVSEDERTNLLMGLLRPVVVASFHLGATAKELRTALDRAMSGIFSRNSGSA